MLHLRFDGAVKLTGVTSADGQNDLTDVDTGNGTVWLSPSTTHTGLKTIGTGTRQHLVDTDNVVWVGADAEVERLLSGSLHHVLVGANTGSLKGLRGKLLILVGDQVDAEWELVNVGLLATEIEDANLWVWDTTVETRLWVRLYVECVSLCSSKYIFHRCHSDDAPDSASCRPLLSRDAALLSFASPTRFSSSSLFPPPNSISSRTGSTYLVLTVAVTSCWTAGHFE